MRYLRLLEQFARTIRITGAESIHEFSRSMPLPPWYPSFFSLNLTFTRDVAIIFHSHCLSPFRFYADMVCRDKDPELWNKGIAFPLERLHHLITNQTWSDPESESMWKKRYPEAPYQVWNADPTATTATAPVLQDVEFECPLCDRTGTIDILSFQKMHLTKVARCICPSCHRTFDADSLSAHFLKKDLSSFKLADGEWYFGLCFSDLTN
jgi:hypothetical protein